MNGDTITAFLPTESSRFHSIQEKVLKNQAEIKFQLRIQTLQVLHGFIERSIAPLQSDASRRMPCETRQGQQMLFHLLMASFNGGIPEAKDLLEFKRLNEGP